MTERILLVGCGKMGGALLAGWLERGIAAEDITVVEPYGTDEVSARHGVRAVAEASRVAPGWRPAVVVFAVKPQAMDEVAPLYAGYAGPGCVFLSIAAGRTIASFARHLGNAAAIVRAMPNTPAAVGRGIAVCCSNANVVDGQRARCQALLEAVGEVGWVENEGLMDAVTAVSGSGPAYVFLMIECLARAGEQAGLDAALAQRLARATVTGSGELARLSADSAETLRKNVTSPGGTTAAALEVLMAEDGLQPLMTRAIAAATQRSKELGG